MIRLSKSYIFSIALVLAALASSGVYAKQLDNLAKVQALFLYNFTNFVEWPSEAFAEPKGDLNLCIYGNPDLAKWLRNFEASLIDEHTLRIVYGEQIANIRSGCHLLFIDQDKSIKLPDFFSAIDYLYVLSVGEQDEFTDKGGVINIFRPKDKLQFSINISNAIANGLFISSDLLALARQVKRHTGN